MGGVAVVVATHGRADRLPALLAALDAQEGATEVVVVDDASADGTAAVLERLAADRPDGRLRTITLPANRGAAAARNAGWRATTADVVAFTDDDCLPGAGWLAALVAPLLEDPTCGVVQGRTTAPPGVVRTEATVGREVPEASPWFEGCNLALRRAALEAAGGFAEELRIYGEDTTLGWTAVEAGWGRAFAAGAVVEHELADRPLRWHVARAVEEDRIVGLAAAHPGLRRSLWRPWCLHPTRLRATGLALALLVAAGGSSRPGGAGRRRSLAAAAALAAPWLLGHRHLLRHRKGPLLLARRALVDLAGVAGRARGSLRARTLLL